MLVPLSAVVQAPNGNYGVFVVADSDGGELARMRTVDIGAVNGSEISVVGPLAMRSSPLARICSKMASAWRSFNETREPQSQP